MLVLLEVVSAIDTKYQLHAGVYKMTNWPNKRTQHG